METRHTVYNVPTINSLAVACDIGECGPFFFTNTQSVGPLNLNSNWNHCWAIKFTDGINFHTEEPV